MEKIKFKSANEKINISDINDFESEVGKEFPDDFKEFLLENNGGYPSDRLFTQNFNLYITSTGENKNQSTDVSQFLSLKEIELDYEDVLDEEYISEYLIPFAYTSFDSQFLINTNKEEYYGAVYYVNYDQCFDDEKGVAIPSKVSNTFHEFIESLFIPTDEYLESLLNSSND